MRGGAQANLLVQVLLLLVAVGVGVRGGAPAGVIQLLFAASALTLAWYAWWHVPFPSLFHWFGACYAGLFLLYPILRPFFRPTFGTAEAVVATYTVLAVAGLHLFVIAYDVGRGRRRQARTWVRGFRVQPRTLSRAVWALIGINMAGALLTVVDTGPLSPGTLSEMVELGYRERNREAGWLSLLGLYCFFFGAPAYALLPAYASREKWLLLGLAAVALLSFDTFLLATRRQRTFLLMHLVALGVGHVYLRHRLIVGGGRVEARVLSDRRPLKKMVACLVVVAAAGLYMGTVRGHIGHAGDFSFLREGTANVVPYALGFDSKVGSDLGYAPTVFRVIEMVPEEHGYLRGQSYYRLLFVPVPRFIWPDKPENTGQIVGTWLYPDREVQSNPPGVMGDLYINFGVWGVLGLIVFGLLFAGADRLSGLSYYLVVAAGFASVFHFARGSFTNSLMQLVAIGIASVLTARYITRD